MGTTRHSSRTPWGAILSLIVALLYGASPIDLIPDLLPLLGIMDDIFVVPTLLLLAVLQWRSVRRTHRSPANPPLPTGSRERAVR